MLLSREQLQERLLALHGASLELVRDVSLEHLLYRIAAMACEQADARYAALGVFGQDGILTEFVSVGLVDEEIKKIEHPPLGKGLLGELRDAISPVRVPSISEHPKSVGFPEHHPEMNSFLGIPIRVGDQQLGQIYLTEKITGSEFTEDDEKIIQMLAAYAYAAIQNARLYENSRRLAVLEERERIGMDLHDGIIQSIYGLGLSLESAFHTLNEKPQDAKEKIQQTMDGLNSVIRDIRSYIMDLKPRQMGDEGLISGLNRLIAEFNSNAKAKVSFLEADTDVNKLVESHAKVLFHICQEALANIAKHSEAKKVQIALWKTEDRLLMEITDDGKGFDFDNMNTSLGHGLANMQSRVNNIGGDIEISSSIGNGTIILAWVPCDIKK